MLHPLVAFVPDVFGQALNGLAYGVLLFLLSVGLTLIFGMLDIVNLAHGSYYMLGAYAGLTRECTVIGAGARVEVWDTDAWTAYLESTEQGFSDQSEEVIPGLL